MALNVAPGDYSPIVELVGLVQARRLLEAQVAVCVEACIRGGLGATEIARVLGVHRATVYRAYLFTPDLASTFREQPR